VGDSEERPVKPNKNLNIARGRTLKWVLKVRERNRGISDSERRKSRKGAGHPKSDLQLN